VAADFQSHFNREWTFSDSPHDLRQEVFFFDCTLPTCYDFRKKGKVYCVWDSRKGEGGSDTGLILSLPSSF